MAFIPSRKVSAALLNASTGLWLERLAGGKIALVCKIPETVIKALYRNAGSALLLAIVRAGTLDILCLGLRINDEPDNPFSAIMPSTSPEDAALLVQALESRAVTLHCVNELNHPVLSASCSLEPDSPEAAVTDFKSTEHWLLTPPSSSLIKLPDLSQILELALDRFQRYIYGAPQISESGAVKMAARIALKLDIWTPTETFEVTPTMQSGPFTIDDDQEGPKLERLIHSIVDSVYSGSSYLSPSVPDRKGTRELADVLGFDSESICVIQAKAMAMFKVDPARSSQRRKAKVEKHIKKALTQLAGTLTMIRSGSPIFDGDGKPISIVKQQTSPAQAIVVLSEMYAFVDWKAVASAVVEASENETHRALFHVVDIRELAILAGNCNDAGTFNHRMIQHWCVVKEKGTAYIRAKLPLSESWRRNIPISER